MARSCRWYAALYLATLLAALIESSNKWLTGVLVFTVPGWPNGAVMALQGISSFAFGVLYDRSGPRVCIAVWAAAYALEAALNAWLLVGLPLGTLTMWAYAAFLALLRPVFVFRVIALNECPPEDRAAVVAHLNVALVLGPMLRISGPLPVLEFLARFVALPALLLCLTWSQLGRGKAVAGGADRAAGATAAGVPAAVLGRRLDTEGTGRAPPTGPLPAPAAMLSRKEGETVGRTLARPAVGPLILLLAALQMGKYMKGPAITLAAFDELQVLISPQSAAGLQAMIGAIFFTLWTCCLGTCVTKLGPQRAMQALLTVAAVADAAATLLSLLPAPLGSAAARGAWLELGVLVSDVSVSALEVICTVFLVGVVGPGERGRLLGAESMGHTFASAVAAPAAVRLYSLGGLAAVLGLCSLGSFASLLLFRMSALLRVKLKEV